MDHPNAMNTYIRSLLVLPVYLSVTTARLTSMGVTDSDLQVHPKATVMSLLNDHLHYQYAAGVQNLFWEETDNGLKFANMSYLYGQFNLNYVHLKEYNFLQMIYALSSERTLYSYCTIELVKRNPPENFQDLKDWINANFNINTELVYKAVKHYSRIIQTKDIDNYKSTNELIFNTVESFSVLDEIFKRKDHETLQWLLTSSFDRANIKYEFVEEAWKNQDLHIMDVILRCMGLQFLKNRDEMDSLLSNETFLEFIITSQSDDNILIAFNDVYFLYDRMVSICFKLDKLAVIKSLEIEYLDWGVVTDRKLLNEIVIGNKLNVLRAMMDLGFLINSFDDEGLTILFRAIHFNNTLMLGAILQAGGDVNVTKDCRKSLLHKAVERNLTYVADKLIELGSPLDKQDCMGLTPLHSAILTNNALVISAIHKKYSESKSTHLMEILHFAAKNGSTGAIEVLLKVGHNVNDVNDQGLNALDFAIKSCRNKNTLRLLNLGAKFSNYKNDSEYLKLAINCNDTETLNYLLDNVISISDALKNEKVLLGLAVDNGYVDILKLLLKKGLNANVMLSTGVPLMVEAVRKNKVECLDVLMEGGASLDLAELHNGVTGQSPPILLHEAAERGSTEAVQWLLARGRAVDQRDREGNTALHHAAAQGRVGAVRALLAAGADPNARNAAGTPVLVEAARGGDLFLVRALLDAGADPGAGDGLLNQSPLHWAARLGRLSLVMELAERGAGLDRPSKAGDTPLHLAADEGNYPVVMELLERGANLNSRNLKGQTPLACAERGHHESIARALRIRGAVL